jgi:hypothetical protein
VNHDDFEFDDDDDDVEFDHDDMDDQGNVKPELLRKAMDSLSGLQHFTNKMLFVLRGYMGGYMWANREGLVYVFQDVEIFAGQKLDIRVFYTPVDDDQKVFNRELWSFADEFTAVPNEPLEE